MLGSGIANQMAIHCRVFPYSFRYIPRARIPSRLHMPKTCQSLARQRHHCTSASTSRCKTRAMLPRCMTAEFCATTYSIISQVYAATVLLVLPRYFRWRRPRGTLGYYCIVSRGWEAPSGCTSRSWFENPVVASNVTPLSQASLLQQRLACVNVLGIRTQLGSAMDQRMSMYQQKVLPE